MTSPDASTPTHADPYRVLIVEDDRSQSVFAEAILRGAGMVTEVVLEADRMMPALESFAPDLVLMDLHLPDASGTELTGRIRQHPRYAHTPVVFLTGDADPERRLEALEQGGDDYILKPVRPRHLIAAIRSRAARARTVTRPDQAAAHHPDTGLYTRAAIMEALGAQVAQAEGGALLLEIANSQSLRTRYGIVGFEALATDAARHLATLAAPHPMARLGDHVFIAVVPERDPGRLEAFARSLRDGLARHAFQAAGEQVRLRCSIGYTPLDGSVPDAAHALAALEEAARAAHANPSGLAAYAAQDVGASAALADVVAASLASGDGRLHLTFQPIVAVDGTEEPQFQVLVRLLGEDDTPIRARDFLPAVHAAGLVRDLDRWVMWRALAALEARRAAGQKVRLFVSQSSRTLAEEGAAAGLAQKLADAGVDGRAVVIDLRLEDALVHTLLLRQACDALSGSGVQFCLSQFRQSEDADALLQRLPLSYVRLDADFAHQPLSQDMLLEMRQVVQTAHALGLKVIGQAVDDPRAAAALWTSGVDFLQGNLVHATERALDYDFGSNAL